MSRVVIVGAGPAGLVVGNLLRAEGIDCLILERRSREHIETRARAGFLAANSVRILTQSGLADGLHANGQHHDTCAFRGEHGEFELKYSALGRGEVHTVYPQQALVRDLIAEFLRRGGEIRFSTTVLTLDPDAASVMCESASGEIGRLTGKYVVGCDGQHGISRQAIPGNAARRFERDHGVTWLAVLADAGPSMAAVTYAMHDNGFAGHMARDATVTPIWGPPISSLRSGSWPRPD